MPGHKSPECLKDRIIEEIANFTLSSVSNMFLGIDLSVNFSNLQAFELSDNDVIFDTGASSSIFSNRNILTNTSNSIHKRRFHGVNGSFIASESGSFLEINDIFVTEKVGVNLLAPNDLEKCGYEWIYNRMFYDGIQVLKDNVIILLFPKNHKTGLFVCDMSNLYDNKNVFAIATNLLYSKKQQDGAEAARDLRRSLGFPSNVEFMKLVKENAIVGSKVVVADVLAANDLFGQETAEIRGKTKYQPSLRLQFHQGSKSAFPTQMLCIDLAYISHNQCFLISVSKPLGLVMVNWLGPEKLSKSASKCRETIENQVKDYAARNFIVNVIKFD